jgi:hypothetical protein
MRCSTVWLYGPRGEPPAVVAQPQWAAAPPLSGAFVQRPGVATAKGRRHSIQRYVPPRAPR